MVVVLQEEISRAEVGVSRRIRSDREGFLILRNGLAPLAFAQIHRAHPFITHGAVGGDFDHLLKFRKRFGVVTEPHICVAQRRVIGPIVGVGGDRLLVSGDGLVTLTAGAVGVA